VALGQMLLISEAGNDGNDYLENCLDEHVALAAEIAREYSEEHEGFITHNFLSLSILYVDMLHVTIFPTEILLTVMPLVNWS